MTKRSAVCAMFFVGLFVSSQRVLAQDDTKGHAFVASFYTGLAIDVFAANELQRYLNPEASGGTRERLIAGFDFDYRLVGEDNSAQQVWLYGETVYGIRSTDVDCEENSTLTVCNAFDPVNAPERTLYILREATSLEVFAGVRWEFLSLQQDSEDAARVYLKAQAGFLTVDGNGEDVVDLHHVGVGLVVANGQYAGSYLEFGVGTTHLFADNFPRFKIDAFLSWEVSGLKKAGIYPFVQLTVDSDLGNGPDSIQSYIGLDLALNILSW